MRASILALAAPFAVAVLLCGCTPGAATPTPISTTSASPTPGASASPTAGPETTAPVTAGIVVVTASTLSVFGTDGSTLLAVDYEADAAGVAARLADVLGLSPTVSTSTEATEVCPTRTFYDFGGFRLGTPQSLGSPTTIGLPGAFDVVVTGDTVNGVAVETIGGQRIGATRSGFEAAIGDEVLLESRGSGSDLGFDIVDPAVGEYDQIGTYAAFEGDVLTMLITPAVVRFVGSCA